MKTAITYTAGTVAPANEKAVNNAKLCMVCGRKLGANPFYFEVNTMWQIIVPGSDEIKSQGCFPVGNECAKKFDANLLIKLGA